MVCGIRNFCHNEVLGFPSEKRLKNGVRRRLLILSVGFFFPRTTFIEGFGNTMGANGKNFRKRTAPDSDSEQPEDDEEIR